MKRFVLFLCLICSLHMVNAQAGLAKDTTYRQQRLFNSNELKQLKADKQFQYERLQEPPLNIWQWFWRWFWWRVERLMSTRQGKYTVWTLLILFGLAMIVFFVTRVLGMNRNSLFGRGGGGNTGYTIDKEDIHSIDFEQAIAAAVQQANYRLAIRLLYLRSLKNLADKGFINWQINKTNSDYVREVSSRPWQARFAQLTAGFEYTWYGGKMIDIHVFNDLQNQFQQFNQQTL